MDSLKKKNIELKRKVTALEKENARLMDALNRETFKYLRLISAITIGMKEKP
jgi:hypothetical protein